MDFIFDFEKFTKWFYEHYMVFIQGKCYFMCLRGNTKDKKTVTKVKKKKKKNTVKYIEEHKIINYYQ